MHSFWKKGLSVALLLVSGTVAMLTAKPAIAQTGTSLLPANTFSAFNYYKPSYATVSTVNVTGQSFTKAFQVTLNQAPPGGSNNYDLGIYAVNVQPIIKGDTILMTFWMKTLAPTTVGSYALAAAVMQQNGGTYAQLMNSIATAASGSGWQQYSIPFIAKASYAISGAEMVFNCNYGPQSFQIGGFALVDYGPNVLPSQLINKFPYVGRDPAAAWRTDAANRIEQYRKANLTVNVVNGSGSPIPGATVSVQQTRSAFKFGSAISQWLLNTGPDGDTYRNTVRGLFNTSVIENDLKWPGWESNRTPGTSEVNWLLANNIPVRGHNLIWPSWGNMPADCQSLSASALRTRIDNHFADELTALNGKCYEWDVLNEPLANNDVQGLIGGVSGITQTNGVLGNGEMNHWFQNAHTLDPNAVLFFNDYNLVEAGGADYNHINYDYALAQYFKANGAPVQGLGFQSHFGNAITPPTRMQAIIDQFAPLNLQCAVTEFDQESWDDALQADFIRDFMTLLYSNPTFHELLMWGFWENSHWLPPAALFRSDWGLKTNAKAYIDLALNQWLTHGTDSTDGNGNTTFRGHLGDYNVTVTSSGRTVTKTVMLSGNTTFTINFNAAALPATPTNLTAEAGNAKAALHWDIMPDAAGYSVKRSANTNGPYSTIAANVARNGYTDVNLTNGTTYYYKIAAVNADGTGADTPTVSAKPFAFTTGLLGKFYNDTTLTTLAFSQLAPTVNYNWGIGSPGPGVGATNWTARFYGSITPPTTDTYTFYADVDDGCRLYVNGKLVIDRFYYMSPTETSGTITLTGNQTVPIALEYIQGTGGGYARLSWASSTIAKQIVPSAQYALSAFVSSHIALDGCPPSGQIMTFEFRPTDGTVKFVREAWLDVYGNFQMMNLPAKNYNVAIKGAKWLQQVVPLDLSKGSIAGFTVSLPGGDANNDNGVDITDFGLFINAFGAQQSDFASSYDNRADFNNDGAVDVGDFGILVNNYGSLGDP